MAKPYKELKQSKISFTLELSGDDMKKALNRVIQSLQQQVEIKGFRKGHAPKEMVVQRAGAAYVQQESMLKAFQKSFESFCKEHDITPIAAPKIDVKEKDKDPIKVEVEVEVFPTIEVKDYKKLTAKVKKATVKDEDVEDYMVKIINEMNLGTSVKRAAKDGDTVNVSFVGREKKGGEEIPQTKGEKTPYTLGSGYYLPDLEKAFIGMKPGEKKEGIKVKFPKEYHAPDFAGKTILFDAQLHDVLEADPKKLTKEQIKQITGEEGTPASFKKKVKEALTLQKQQEAKKEAISEYQNELAKKVKVDLPESWLAQETENRMSRLKNHPAYKRDKEMFLKQMNKTEEELEKTYREDGEKNLKQFLGLKYIIEQEDIQLEKPEEIQVEVMTEQQMKGKAKKGSADYIQHMHQLTIDFKINKYLQSLVDEKKEETKDNAEKPKKKPAAKKTTKKAE